MNTELRDELLNTDAQQNTGSEQPAALQENDTPPAPRHRKHHSSAMCAASKWHSAVKHVKSPNGGHSMLPVQM